MGKWQEYRRYWKTGVGLEENLDCQRVGEMLVGLAATKRELWPWSGMFKCIPVLIRSELRDEVPGSSIIQVCCRSE